MHIEAYKLVSSGQVSCYVVGHTPHPSQTLHNGSKHKGCKNGIVLHKVEHQTQFVPALHHSVVQIINIVYNIE